MSIAEAINKHITQLMHEKVAMRDIAKKRIDECKFDTDKRKYAASIKRYEKSLALLMKKRMCHHLNSQARSYKIGSVNFIVARCPDCKAQT